MYTISLPDHAPTCIPMENAINKDELRVMGVEYVAALVAPWQHIADVRSYHSTGGEGKQRGYEEQDLHWCCESFEGGG